MVSGGYQGRLAARLVRSVRGRRRVRSSMVGEMFGGVLLELVKDRCWMWVKVMKAREEEELLM